MSKNKIINIIFWITLTSAMPALAFFKVPDTDFGANFSEAVAYETNSLLMKFNYKTNDLDIGPYSGT